jgi:MFS family permease
MLNRLSRRADGIVTLYSLYSFLEAFALIYPAYLVLFRREGLSVASISLLLGASALPVILLELPSGALADLVGRRRLVVIGILCKAAGFALWAFGGPGAAGLAAYAAGFLLWGAQDALCSGAQEALLYDALREVGAEGSYARAAGRARASASVGTALAMAIGGSLAEASPSAALWATVGTTLLAALAAASLPEPARGPTAMPGARQLAEALRDGLASCSPGSGLGRLLLFGGLAGAGYGLLDEYDQLYLEALGLGLPLIGLLCSARFLVEGLGALGAERLGLALGLSRDRRLGAWLALAGAALLGAALGPPAIALSCYALAYLILSSGSVLFEARVQAGIESRGRATVMSLYSLGTNASALVLAGLLAALSRAASSVPSAGPGDEVRACVAGIACLGIIVPLLFARAPRPSRPAFPRPQA